jgi:O-antigen ligase
MALVALFGLLGLRRDAHIPSDISRVGRITIGFYLALVIVDLVNGGGLVNLQSTGFNYLHLVAVAPFALALRRVGLDLPAFDRAMQVTILIALAAAVVQFFFFNVVRPGGLFLNPIPYGFVVALWGVFLLSRGLEQGKDGAFSIAVGIAAFVPVLLTESKIDWGCMILGYVMTAVWWAVVNRRWKTIAAAAAAAVPVTYLAFELFAFRRLELFMDELRVFLADGTVSAQSFGWRYELATSGLRAFWEKPALGYGLSEHMTAIFAHPSTNGPDITLLPHAHNDYVTHLVSFGVPGLAFVVAFLVFAAWLAHQCADAGARRAGFAMAAMLALYMSFEIAFNMDPISGPVTVVFGLLLLRPRNAGLYRRGDD